MTEPPPPDLEALALAIADALFCSSRDANAGQTDEHLFGLALPREEVVHLGMWGALPVRAASREQVEAALTVGYSLGLLRATTWQAYAGTTSTEERCTITVGPAHASYVAAKLYAGLSERLRALP